MSEYLQRAIDIAAESAVNGGGPFGAVVVTADGQVFEGTNAVTRTNDPSAHAEVVALRNAGRELGTHDLSGATLYSSCEPCPMCLSASMWARIDRLIYAANADEAAEAGFDDRVFYEHIRGESTPFVYECVASEARLRPFQAWQQNATRVDY